MRFFALSPRGGFALLAALHAPTRGQLRRLAAARPGDHQPADVDTGPAPRSPLQCTRWPRPRQGAAMGSTVPIPTDASTKSARSKGNGDDSRAMAPDKQARAEPYPVQYLHTLHSGPDSPAELPRLVDCLGVGAPSSRPMPWPRMPAHVASNIVAATIAAAGRTRPKRARLR